MFGATRLVHSSSLALLAVAAAASALPACTCGVPYLSCTTSSDCRGGAVCSAEWGVCVRPAGYDARVPLQPADAASADDAGEIADAGTAGDAGEPADSGPADSGGVEPDAGTGGPVALELTGPGIIGQATCRLFRLGALDARGNRVPVDAPVDVTLIGRGSGYFYADSLCSLAIDATTLGPGVPSRDFYLRDDFAEELVLTAEARGLVPAAAGIKVVAFEQVWTQETPGTIPPTLQGHKAVYHRGRRSIVVYGGWDGSCADHQQCLSSTMWEYDGSTWSPLCLDCAPGGRYVHGLVYDSQRDKVVLFGGSTKEVEFSNDVWEWDAELGWVLVDAGGDPQTRPDLPSPRNRSHFTWDEARNVAVLYGGYSVDAGAGLDTWEYDAATRAWTQLSNPNGVDPGPNCDWTNDMVFDPAASRMLLYGGFDCTGTRRDDLWSWDGAGWSQVCAECTGLSREGHGLVVDLARGKLVVAQGFMDSSQEVEGVWEQDLARIAQVPWPKLNVGPTPARDGMTLTWYPELGASVFFGGNTCGTGCNFAETWLYGGP
ncbi:MAG TPA: hypothetical protein VGK67_22170 [Myxococcales bacterium]|jgi:hypothetical protein